MRHPIKATGRSIYLLGHYSPRLAIPTFYFTCATVTGRRCLSLSLGWKSFSNNINPFEYSPSEVHEFKELRIQNPENYYKIYNERNERELEKLSALKWESPKSLKYLERVNHLGVPTIYPPMAQFVFRAVHSIKPDSILAMRIAFLLFDVLNIGFHYRDFGQAGIK